MKTNEHSRVGRGRESSKDPFYLHITSVPVLGKMVSNPSIFASPEVGERKEVAVEGKRNRKETRPLGIFDDNNSFFIGHKHA